MSIPYQLHISMGCITVIYFCPQACEVQHSKHKSIAKLDEHGLLNPDVHHTPQDVSKELASLHIYHRYFHNQRHVGDPIKDDNAKAHFLHYK